MTILEQNIDRASLSPEEWKKLTRFDSTDVGWIIISIGMAIGAGLCFTGPWGLLDCGYSCFLPSLVIRPCTCFKDCLSIRWQIHESVKTIPVSSRAIWEKLGNAPRSALLSHAGHLDIRLPYGVD